MKSSLLCPNCKKIISYDESKCPYCGLIRPGSIWIRAYTLMFSGQERIINIIIILNIIMYIISAIIDPSHIRIDLNPLKFLSPSNESLLLLGATGRLPIDHLYRWWSLISASYLHGSLLHIFFNMAAMRQIGVLILREYGSNRFFIIYFFSGIFGFLASWASNVSLSVGASGSLCGLIGAALYFGKSRGGIYGQAVYKQVSGWVISIFLFGILVPGIDNLAHCGGLITGIVSGFLLGYHEKIKENKTHTIIAVFSLFITICVLLWAVCISFLVTLEM